MNDKWILEQENPLTGEKIYTWEGDNTKKKIVKSNGKIKYKDM